MKIACIGGGPAGLYLGILVKRVAPQHEVVIYERNRPTDTFGFGVVFSDATLGNLADADPETHAQITSRFARWDDIEVHALGTVMRSTGHGFCGIERKQLLAILQARATELGVRIEFEHPIASIQDVQADVIVACDGVGSSVRDALAAEIQPHVDVRPNRFVWLGCTVPYEAFTFLFEQTKFGLFRVHAYRFRDAPAGELCSTFIAECRDDTWRAAGFATADEDQTVAILETLFADHLRGHRLVKNRSIWRNFPTVRCRHWHTGNVVLVGDAVHTAHFSIGSGTKLAMEDMIALRDALLAHADVPTALAAYEARRRPDVEALQAAAQASLEWFEGTERYLGMTPVQFNYSLMTRSLRMSHNSVTRRDPELAAAMVEQLATTHHAAPNLTPLAMPFALPVTPSPAVPGAPPQTVRSRVVVSDPETTASLMPAAGLVMVGTPDPAAVATAHAGGARIALRVASSANSWATAHAHGFDGLVLAPGDAASTAPADQAGIATEYHRGVVEALPATIATARAAWPADRFIGAVVHDRPSTRAAVVGHAAQLVRAGATLLVVDSVVLADRLRNELHVATCVVAGDARPTDLDAMIAAGRADLVLVS